MKILIKNSLVVDMENEEPYISDVLVENDKITKIEKNITEQVDKVIDGTNKVLMPGLVNTHGHLGMSIFRTYGENKQLMDWLNNYILPKEQMLTKELIHDFSLLSCIEAIKSGTTNVVNTYFSQEVVADAYKEIGIRGIIGSTDSYQNNPIDLFEYVKNIDKEDMIKVYCDPHSPYTCSTELLKENIENAKKHNTGIQIHLAETQDEIDIIKERYNLTPTEYLDSIGMFDVPVILAHGIYINENDIEILKKIKGGISHNPISNAKLASGICDVVNLRKNNINVGIGTDGPCPTTSLDMFLEMKTCGYLQKLKYMDSSIISSYDILKMATIEGAKVLCQEDEIGSIKVGKKADLILIDIQKPHLVPALDIHSLLVYGVCGSDVDTVMINGKIVMQNRVMIAIDEQEIMYKCEKSAKKFYSKESLS